MVDVASRYNSIPVYKVLVDEIDFQEHSAKIESALCEIIRRDRGGLRAYKYSHLPRLLLGVVKCMCVCLCVYRPARGIRNNLPSTPIRYFLLSQPGPIRITNISSRHLGLELIVKRYVLYSICI